VLKMMVICFNLCSPSKPVSLELVVNLYSNPPINGPKIIMNNITHVFQKVIPRIYLQIVGVKIFVSDLNGSPLRTESSGGSVASANAAKVSMIKLIQRSYTAERGDSAKIGEPMMTVRITERFTVIWN